MAPSFNRPIERIRSLKTVLYDATGVYHPHCFYLRDVTPEDGATNVQRFALLMLSSLDYELWIHGSDGKPACRLTGVHLYEASIWSGECVIYIHQKDARAASAEGGACFGGGGRSAGSLRGGGPLFGAAGAPPAAGGGAPIISTVHGANDYLSERRSSSSAEATAYKNNLGGGIPDVGAERRSSGETALHAHSWRPSSWSTASHRESGAVVDNYLRPHVHRLQRFLKRHYHKVSSSGFRAVQELFDSHCARCNTGGLDWDMILLAPDPDAYLLSLLQRNKLLLPFEQGSSNCQGGHHLPVVRRGGHVSQHVNNGGTAGGLTGDHHSTGGGRPGIHRTGSFAPPTGGDLDLLLPDHPVLEPQFSAPPHRSRGGAAHPLREYSSLLHHRARDEQAALLDDLCGLDERAIGSCIARGVLLPRPANQMLSAFKTTLPPGGGQEGAEARLTEEAVRSLNVRRLGLRGDHLPPGGSGDSSSVGGGSADLLAHRDGKAGTIDATAVAEPSHRDAAADGLSAMVESSAMGATAGFHTHTAGSNQRQPMGPFGGDAPPGARRGGGVAGADSVGSETTGGPKPSSEFSRDVLQRLAEIENELYIVKKCNLIYALSTMGGNERSRTSASSVSCAVSSAGAATSSDVEKASSKIYELLRARIVRIVLIIGDAFRKKLEKTLYAGDSGDTAGLDRRHNFRSRTPAFGTSGLNSGLLQHSGDSGPHRISAGGGLLTTTIHSSRAIDHRRTLSFHTLVQVGRSAGDRIVAHCPFTYSGADRFSCGRTVFSCGRPFTYSGTDVGQYFLWFGCCEFFRGGTCITNSRSEFFRGGCMRTCRQEYDRRARTYSSLHVLLVDIRGPCSLVVADTILLEQVPWSWTLTVVVA